MQKVFLDRLTTPFVEKSMLPKTETLLRSDNHMVDQRDVEHGRRIENFSGQFYIAVAGLCLP